jgi:hypothetical protein
MNFAALLTSLLALLKSALDLIAGRARMAEREETRADGALKSENHTLHTIIEIANEQSDNANNHPDVLAVAQRLRDGATRELAARDSPNKTGAAGGDKNGNARHA